MSNLYDFWQAELDYSGNWAVSLRHPGNPFGAIIVEFNGNDVESSYPTDLFDQIHTHILDNVSGTSNDNAWGVRLGFSQESPGGRPDRFIEFFGPQEFYLTFSFSGGGSDSAELLGFDPGTIYQSSQSGSVHVIRAPSPFSGAFAAPRKNFIYSKGPDPYYDQSHSRPYRGPMQTVVRARRDCFSVLYRYLAGPYIYKSRHSRPNLLDHAKFEEGWESLAFEEVWTYLRAGKSVRYANLIPGSTEPTTFPAPVPFGADYEGREVYFLDDDYMRSMESALTDTRESVGFDSYHLDLKVYSDA